MLASIRITIFGDLPTIGQLIQHAGYPWPKPVDPSEPNPFGEPPPMMAPPPGNLLWVVVPDFVANARDTYAQFQWLHPLMADLPLAFAVQDGRGDVGIPWGAPGLRCLFLAGSDRYKLSAEMAEIAACRQTARPVDSRCAVQLRQARQVLRVDRVRQLRRHRCIEVSAVDPALPEWAVQRPYSSAWSRRPRPARLASTTGG